MVTPPCMTATPPPRSASSGAPIEGPTHFSQFDPLAYLLWGQEWFERGCISSHFQTMVVEGEQVQASITRQGGKDRPNRSPQSRWNSRIGGDGIRRPAASPNRTGRPAGRPRATRVSCLSSTSSKWACEPIVSCWPWSTSESNGAAYPFSLADKLRRITEPHPWYTPEGARSSPWGRQVVPMEMISVLAYKSAHRVAGTVSSARPVSRSGDPVAGRPGVCRSGLRP